MVKKKERISDLCSKVLAQMFLWDLWMQSPCLKCMPYVYLTLEGIGKADNACPWAWRAFKKQREVRQMLSNSKAESPSHNGKNMSFGVRILNKNTPIAGDSE